MARRLGEAIRSEETWLRDGGVPNCWHPPIVGARSLAAVDPDAAAPGVRRLLESEEAPMRGIALRLLARGEITLPDAPELLFAQYSRTDSTARLTFLRSLMRILPMDRELAELYISQLSEIPEPHVDDLGSMLQEPGGCRCRAFPSPPD